MALSMLAEGTFNALALWMAALRAALKSESRPLDAAAMISC